jgi:hypothetical protein
MELLELVEFIAFVVMVRLPCPDTSGLGTAPVLSLRGASLNRGDVASSYSSPSMGED